MVDWGKIAGIQKYINLILLSTYITMKIIGLKYIFKSARSCSIVVYTYIILYYTKMDFL